MRHLSLTKQDLCVCTTTTSASSVPVAESATAIPKQNEPREPSHGGGKNNAPVSTKFDAKKAATAGRADRSVSVGTAASKPPTIPAFLNDEPHKFIPISGCKLPPGASYAKRWLWNQKATTRKMGAVVITRGAAPVACVGGTLGHSNGWNFLLTSRASPS
ncbi:hypothetical protein Pelo_10386 [Pelomyxa schiedti]|nr:hypothetical protein Pelo_10386 [Pelomyxa schiedti]